jgi:2-oxoisovalerate dehydrogenase E1 component
MAKKLMVIPEKVRRAETLELGSIPVNSYKKTVAQEIKAKSSDITEETCLRVYRDMALIREFETMLNQIKTLGAYQGIEYIHAGPAHLSIGQEGAAVGECLYLDVEDHIYGSHRSHGEILAKGLAAIKRLAGGDLVSLMQNYFDGTILKIVEGSEIEGAALKMKGKAKFVPGDEEELGIDFLLFGLLSEVFGRETGFNKGMGGSMHAFFTPFGIFPNNAIVGGSADIATGAALAKKCLQAAGIVVANIGDASSGCGPVWEAMQFSAMGQFRNLWEGAYKGGLPLVFNFMNNFYGMGGQPIGETMGFERLARSGAAINPENMHAECVDGNNPLAVAEAYKRKKKILAEGKGPVLLEVICYRQSGHSPSDQSSYRERDEIEMWRAVDPLTEFAAKLVDAGVATQKDIDAIHAYATAKVVKACKLGTDDKVSPRMKLGTGITLDTFMFSNEFMTELPGLKHDTDVCMPLAENPRVVQLAKKSRTGIDADGKVLKEGRAVSFRDGVFEAIAHHFYNDWRVVAYGEENRDWGGAFAVYRGLTEALPYNRLFNSPISEAAIVGTAVGFALEGGRPIVELMYCDFMGRSGDEVFNQLPKWQAMSGGYCKMPVVLRVSVGSKYGAQHSQDWTTLCAHVPGLKVVFPATPYSAKGLMASALSGSDPVVYFESQRLYDITETFEPGGVPAEYYTLPIGEPAVVKEGTDLTILTFGATLYRANAAAKRFEEEFGISVELIDGRSLVPFNIEKVVESVKKTGKIMLCSDACEVASFLHTVASRLSQVAFDSLDAPPVIIGARNWIVPPAELEEFYYPQVEWILDAYHTNIKPLPGYTPSTTLSPEEILLNGKYGIVG